MHLNKAPTFFVPKLPVALAKAPVKIAIRQRLGHTSGVIHTHIAGTRAWDRNVTVSSNCVNPILGVQTD